MTTNTLNQQKLAYTVNEVLAAIGIGRTKLYQEIAKGDLKTFKIGKRTLIASDDLMAWLNAQRAA